MNIASLFSGGKDSAYAMFMAQKEEHEVKVLITVRSENPESYMFHVPNIDLTKMQAEAMEIPLLFKSTMGVKEEELKDLKDAVLEAMNRYEITGLVSGAIYSNYQRKRIDDIASELGLKSLLPLWKRKPKKMLKEMVDEGFKIIISAVAAGGLGPEWLGRKIDHKTIEALSCLHDTCYVCTAGEGGEFETLVVDAPFFNKRIEIMDAEKTWDGQSGIYVVKDAQLVEKEN
ncbi:MAG: TIGR00289 family protein [Methanomassiliicoccales archaeon]|nr:MAG: TIGR00289 family protein [Methanomassiliicoccales archaeon]